jgi:hypothetical protein
MKTKKHGIIEAYQRWLLEKSPKGLIFGRMSAKDLLEEMQTETELGKYIIEDIESYVFRNIPTNPGISYKDKSYTKNEMKEELKNGTDVFINLFWSPLKKYFISISNPLELVVIGEVLTYWLYKEVSGFDIEKSDVNKKLFKSFEDFELYFKRTKTDMLEIRLFIIGLGDKDTQITILKSISSRIQCKVLVYNDYDYHENLRNDIKNANVRCQFDIFYKDIDIARHIEEFQNQNH